MLQKYFYDFQLYFLTLQGHNTAALIRKIECENKCWVDNTFNFGHCVDLLILVMVIPKYSDTLRQDKNYMGAMANYFWFLVN